MSWRWRGCTLALLLAFPDPSAAEDTRLCFSEVELSSERAVVGEQVLYRVRIFSREDASRVEWSHPPAFPNFRTETLPGDPQPAGTSPGDFRVRDERRALFAERPGTHLLKAPPLRCTSVDGKLSVARVPEVVLRVDALPDAGMPDDFSGLVGELGLFVTVTPVELSLGESLRVAVMARSGGNLWALPQPFAADAFGSAEIFDQRPKLVLERGRTLSLRRHFAFDVVPRETGRLEVPALAIPFFDPAAREYRVARSEAVQVQVKPRALAPPAGGSTSREAVNPNR